MSARPYLQSALSELQSALTDLQRQMNDMQHQTNAEKQQLQQDVARLQQEAHAHEAAIHRQEDDAERHVFMQRMEQANREGDEKRARIGQLEGEIATALNAKNQAYAGLQGLVQQLNGFLAMPDI